MRLIDADLLIKRLVPLWNFHDDSDFANKDVWREIGNVPTVDAISVVRCRDCECWYPEEDEEYGHCRKHDFWTSESWYCADGEER